MPKKAAKKRPTAKSSKHPQKRGKSGIKPSKAKISIPKSAPKEESSITIALKPQTYQEPKPIVPRLPTLPQSAEDAKQTHHHHAAWIFAVWAIVGFGLSMYFLGRGEFIYFAFSGIVFVIAIDNLVVAIREKSSYDDPIHPSKVHRISALLFLLLSIISIVFAITFYARGDITFALLSLGAFVIGVDNCIHARKNLRFHLGKE